MKCLHHTGGVELEISDNGRGLSPEQLKRFHESNGGRGVGIAGMSERVRSLGGRLSVQSNGNGMTLTVSRAAAQGKSANSKSKISVAL